MRHKNLDLSTELIMKADVLSISPLSEQLDLL